MIRLMMTLSYGVPVRKEQKRVFLVVRYSYLLDSVQL